MWSYNYNELYHYGVPGMHWGERKAAIELAKGEYRQSKQEYRKAIRKAPLTLVSNKNVKKSITANDSIEKARLNRLDAKANYKGVKSKNSEKAQINTYAREMNKYGRPGSNMDRSGFGTKLYKHLSKTKGQDFADKVLTKNRNDTIATVAVSAAVAVGLSAISTYLRNNR